MDTIVFYRDAKGREPVKEYVQQLAAQQDKSSRIKLNKIWELRPLRDRILFVAWVDGQLVLLHQFMKTTQKTPKREIERDQAYLDDLKARSEES